MSYLRKIELVESISREAGRGRSDFAEKAAVETVGRWANRDPAKSRRFGGRGGRHGYSEAHRCAAAMIDRHIRLVPVSLGAAVIGHFHPVMVRRDRGSNRLPSRHGQRGDHHRRGEQHCEEAAEAHAGCYAHRDQIYQRWQSTRSRNDFSSTCVAHWGNEIGATDLALRREKR